MMTMIDKVVAALQASDVEPGMLVGSDLRPIAIAVIAAMREPTAAMISAGAGAMPTTEGYDLHDDCVRPWQAMIEAAIAEETA